MTSAEAAKQSAIRELEQRVAECRDRAKAATTDWDRAAELTEAARLEAIIAQKKAPPFTDGASPSGWGPANYRGFRRIIFQIFGA